MQSWYAIHSRSNFEKRIGMELEGKGIEHYLPAYNEIHQWKDRKRVVSVPLFPGYVFARFVDEPGLRRSVLTTSGIVRILGNSAGIEPVPDSQIEAVRNMLNSRVPCFAHPLLREGTPVRVTRGPLEGVEGLLARIKNQTRLVISIPLLNQSVAAEVNAWDVRPLGAGTEPLRA
jgi:transcription antitermination factor NusG